MQYDQWLVRIRETINTLPICGEETFERLWSKKLLRCSDVASDELGIDAASAALVCACLDEKEQLLILLPDQNPCRPALLLAAALIIDATDSISTRRPAQRVLYVGSSIGIREQLASVHAGNLRLADVFSQSRASQRAFSDASTQVAEYLPHVLTAYAPADPAGLLDAYFPAWIAVDCGGGNNLKWLDSLLSSARKRRIPVVAWGHNPLSDTVQIFAKHHANIFQWPPAPWLHAIQRGVRPPNARAGALCLEGPEVEAIENHLGQAYHTLSAVTRGNTPGRMERDALGVAWRQQRLLESLALPLSVYESEAGSYWGLRTVRHGQETLQAFVRALHQAGAGSASPFGKVNRHLEEAIKEIDRRGPPHWHALAELCITDVEPGAARILLFPSDAVRNLFDLALLAFYNVTLDELATLGLTLVSAREFYGSGHRAWIGDSSRTDAQEILRVVSPDKWQLVVPGLPSQHLLARLEPAFRAGSQIDFLVYSHQLGPLSWRLDQCISALSVRGDQTARTLRALKADCNSLSLPDLPATLGKGEVSMLRPQKRGEIPQLLQQKSDSYLDFDPVVEAARLFGNEVSEEDEHPQALGNEELIEIQKEDETLFVEHAVEVSFEERWHGLFAQDAVLNVLVQVPADHDIQQRYVRSLRPGDIVLFIHGQRRQNLYDLIIQRIHNHPAFALHLELIRQWQKEVVTAYRQWCRQGDGSRGAEALHLALQKKGSNIKDWHTVAQWVDGQRFRTRDKEDMRRLAEVMDMDFVRRHYRRIHEAGGRIHGIHIQLGRLLTGWLLSGAEARGLLDEELGLSFDDLRSSLLRLRVRTVQMVHGAFYREHLGELERH